MTMQLDWMELALLCLWPVFVYGLHVKLTGRWKPFPTTLKDGLLALLGGTVLLGLALLALTFLLFAAVLALCLTGLRFQAKAFRDMSNAERWK